MHRWRRRDVYAEVIAERRNAQHEAATTTTDVSEVVAETDCPVDMQPQNTHDKPTGKIARFRQLSSHVLDNLGINYINGPNS